MKGVRPCSWNCGKLGQIQGDDYPAGPFSFSALPPAHPRLSESFEVLQAKVRHEL